MEYSGTEITDLLIHNNYVELIVHEGKVVEIEHIKQDFEYCRSISPNKEYGFMLVAKPYSDIQ